MGDAPMLPETSCAACSAVQARSGKTNCSTGGAPDGPARPRTCPTGTRPDALAAAVDMGHRKIGIATCVGLLDETQRLVEYYRRLRSPPAAARGHARQVAAPSVAAPPRKLDPRG